MYKKRSNFFMVELLAALALFMVIAVVVQSGFYSSFQQGKAFRSQEGSKRIAHSLMLQTGTSSTDDLVDNWQEILKREGMKETMFKDGWGKEYYVEYTDENGFEVHSPGYESYMKKKGMDPGEYWS